MRHWLEAGREELRDWLRAAGQPAYRADQVFHWLHRRRAAEAGEMANLPAALRRRLAGEGVIRGLDELGRRATADGLTRKLLFAAPDRARLESVLILEKRGSRRTLCLSCMSGCPLACRFCASGRLGFVRDLSAGEILEQAYRLDALARETGENGASHVVFMGMGEPLLNFGAVLAALDRLIDSEGLGLSGRHATISTIGVTEGILRLAESGRNCRLALSLHAPERRLRERLLPATRRWPLPGVLAALDAFASGRSVTYEYCLVEGINASPRQAEKLARLLAGRRGKVNLIPLNPVPGLSWRPPPPAEVREFQAILMAAGIPATVRMEKGAEIGAACGQLRAEAGAD
ncbi:MAG: 23S rRNA (adenine(2503)-C(2))-methyltransferase RlmN [Planctomycetota bacterium]|jgi:23S rRNA (adenine2503-C2)-methyltransferase|nr:23S rRNA (adenine(2503)-C(2))-methyltransferase RlmN [Planctomycetota bacterium]